MRWFDKPFAAVAYLFGLLMVVAGTFGLINGWSLRFELTPLTCLVPIAAGWGIIRAVSAAWSATPRCE